MIKLNLVILGMVGHFRVAGGLAELLDVLAPLEPVCALHLDAALPELGDSLALAGPFLKEKENDR